MTVKVPQMKRSEALASVSLAGVVLTNERFVILAIRGYFRQTMGDPTKNDRGIYDDAMFIISETVYVAYQANTDPSVYKTGTAVLVPGVYDVEKHMHKGEYPAWQIIEDKVKRDGVPGVDVGRHGINIHHGGIGTWSEGCQTLPPTTWPGFQRLSYDLADTYKKKTVKYILTENVT